MHRIRLWAWFANFWLVDNTKIKKRFYWNTTSLWFVSSQDDQKQSLSLLRNFLVGENIRKLFNHLKTALKLLIFISRRKFDFFSSKSLNWLPILYCCLIVVAPHLNECWMAGHTCSNGHISSFLIQASKKPRISRTFYLEPISGQIFFKNPKKIIGNLSFDALKNTFYRFLQLVNLWQPLL